MKILIAADGSPYTKKALGFLMAHEQFRDAELVVLHVQAPLPPRVRAFVGGTTVAEYHEEEARKILDPIEEFLKRHEVTYQARWVLGQPADEIVEAAAAERAHLIVMGTHGYGVLGRAIMGSVAQKVVTGSEIPVLLVK